MKVVLYYIMPERIISMSFVAVGLVINAIYFLGTA